MQRTCKEGMPSTVLFCLLMKLAFATLPANGHGADLMYSYVWNSQLLKFETLAEAEQSLRSRPAPADTYQRVRTELSTDGRTVWHYEVPEEAEPIDLGIHSYGCFHQRCWYSISELIAHRTNIWNSWGECVLDARFEGSWTPFQWANSTYGSSAPPDGADIHLISSGGMVVGDVVTRINADECKDEPPRRAEWSFVRYDAYDCPEGYQIEGGNAAKIPCVFRIKQRIWGPISGGCEDASAGNPCGVITGKKMETAADYTTDELRFERHYNSSQMN